MSTAGCSVYADLGPTITQFIFPLAPMEAAHRRLKTQVKGDRAK